MNNKDIEWQRKKLKAMKQDLASGQLNAVRELLTPETIEDICAETQYEFRDRFLSPLVTIFHMIQAGLSPEGSFQSAWHLNGQSGKSGTLAKARKRLPLRVWSSLQTWIVQQIQKESTEEDLWQGHRMVAVDGTCVSMSDEEALVEHFGCLKTSKGEMSRFPLAQVSIAVDLKTMTTIAHRAGNYRTSEPALLRKLFCEFQRGDVLIFDRLYAGSNLYAECQQAGLGFIGRAHCSTQMEERIMEAIGPGDFMVELPIYKRSRRQNRSLPKAIRLRAIKTTVKIRGQKQTVWLVTSLLDARQYPAVEICSWYKKRWKIETLIGELKTWLGADVLRSKSVEGVYKELYARVIGLNLIHWLILKAARQHGKKAEGLSVSAALRLSTAYSLKMSTAPAWRLPFLYAELLEHIASSAIIFRPHRLEPRMQKREPRNYPKLKISRSEWRTLHVLAA